MLGLGSVSFLVFYVLSISLFLFIFLFGEAEAFKGTTVATIHAYLNGGLCDSLEWLVGRCCGERGLQAWNAIGVFCCARRNPILQLFYLALLGGAYYFAGNCVWSHVPGPFVYSFHRYFGPLFVLGCLVSFLLTSFADPGTITSYNLQHHSSSYPYDGVIYTEKLCTTCNIIRPARSKHCSICDRCVARFDHHCAWMNNCVAENNLRFFILFLVSHCLLCCYGATLVACILLGELQQRNVMGAAVRDQDGGTTSLRDRWSLIFLWLMTHYSHHMLLLIFAALVALLIGGFLGYHIYLLVSNTTTNETFKFSDYKRWLRDRAKRIALQEAKAAEAARMAASGEMEEGGLSNTAVGSNASSSTDVSHRGRWFSIRTWKFWRRSGTPKVKIPKVEFKNIYDRGLRHNVVEGLFPVSSRSSKKVL